MRIIEQLQHHAHDRRDAPAVVELNDTGAESRVMTWGQWRRGAEALAAQLRRRMPMGSVVILTCTNRGEYLPAFFGTLMAGMRLLPCAATMTAGELADIAASTGAAAVLADAAGSDKLRGIVDLHLPIDGLHESAALDTQYAPSDTHAAALMLQSSGTTGAPKIVQRSLDALDADGFNCVNAVELGRSDRLHMCIPLTHSYGIDFGVLAATIAGCTVEIATGFDRHALCVGLAERGVSVVPGVPFMFEMLAEGGDAQVVAPDLRHAISAGAPLPARVYESFMQRSGVQIGQLYGATEMGSVTYANPGHEHFDPTSVGRPLGGVTIRIVDPEAAVIDRPMPTGGEGMVAVRAPSLFDGYLNHATDQVLDGFFLTNDLGRLDEHGNLTITGRTSLLIDVGGLKVNPVEVESVLTQHPDVRDAVVVPTPVTQTLRRIRAVVTAQPGREVDTDDLRRFVRDRLSPHKVPRVIEVRDALPRTPTGKVNRQALSCT